MALPAIPLKWIGTVWDLARKVQDLLEAQDKASKAIAEVDDDVQRVKASLREEVHALKLEIERLKVREEVLIAEAKAAAAVAAGAVAAQSTADTMRRIGVLEGRLLSSRTPGASSD